MDINPPEPHVSAKITSQTFFDWTVFLFLIFLVRVMNSVQFCGNIEFWPIFGPFGGFFFEILQAMFVNLMMVSHYVVVLFYRRYLSFCSSELHPV